MSYFLKANENTDISHKMIPETDLSSSVWNKIYFAALPEQYFHYELFRIRT